MIKIPVSRNLTKAFRHLLCEERKKRGATQFELARKSGLTRQCISLLESGRRVPTFFSLLNLANGFDMPLSKFMSLLISKVEYYECCENSLLAADSKKTKWRHSKQTIFKT
jgi:transcriptional regulator with XRE-family HTH domain